MKHTFAIFLVLLQTSCAFIFNKKEVPVSFKSIPDDANVYINGDKIGKTPMTIDLVPGGYFDIIYTKTGYANREFKIYSSKGRDGLQGLACTLDLLGVIAIIPMPLTLPSYASNYCNSFNHSYSKSLDQGVRNNVLIQNE